MTRDRSLDEFLGGEPGDADATDEGEEGDAEPAPAEPADAEPAAESADPDDDAEPATDPDSDPDDAVEPAVSTYEFSPDGAPCAACGAVVEKRWRDDGELVCPDCKVW